MRKIAIASAISLAAALSLPIGASANDQGSPEGVAFEKVVNHNFIAPVPCAAACPYWTDTNNATCNPEPLAVPPPAGMYDDWDFKLKLPANSPAEGIVFFVFSMSPAVDHDGWMCLQEAHPDNPGVFYLENSANIVGQICGTIPMVGCAEKNEINVCVDKKWSDNLKGFNWACIPANSPVRFRDYNWGDPVAVVPAWVCWSKEGVKPDGKGCAGSPFAGR